MRTVLLLDPSETRSLLSVSATLLKKKKKYLVTYYFWLHWVFVAACRLFLVSGATLRGVHKERLSVVASFVVEHRV